MFHGSAVLLLDTKACLPHYSYDLINYFMAVYEVYPMSSSAATFSRPHAYWDRSANVVRDWKTDQALPDYEGRCMVYLDIQGPVFMNTYLRNGERCWDRSE
jgi:hypothetical protein